MGMASFMASMRSLLSIFRWRFDPLRCLEVAVDVGLACGLRCRALFIRFLGLLGGQSIAKIAHCGLSESVTFGLFVFDLVGSFLFLWFLGSAPVRGGSLLVEVECLGGLCEKFGRLKDEDLQDVHGADGVPCWGLYIRWLWGLCDAHGRAYFSAGLITLREDRPYPDERSVSQIRDGWNSF